MKIYRIAQLLAPLIRGYKAVGVTPEGQGYSLYGGKSCYIDLTIGGWMKDCPTSKGFYLGSSKEYVLTYYSGLTDDDELLLTYEFSKDDLLEGDPDSICSMGSELRVSQAQLIDKEEIAK